MKIGRRDNKYFTVNDKDLADIMEVMLNQRYYVFTNEYGKKVYTFKRTMYIDKAYGKALKMLNR